MKRPMILLGTAAALVLVWLASWPVATSNCPIPPTAFVVCSPASTVGASLVATGAEWIALGALLGILLLGLAGLRLTRARN